jgi:hypothetical protein
MQNMEPVFACRTYPAINDLIRTAGDCPNCGADNDHLTVMHDPARPSLYALECNVCERRGQLASGLEGAVRHWKL